MASVSPIELSVRQRYLLEAAAVGKMVAHGPKGAQVYVVDGKSSTKEITRLVNRGWLSVPEGRVFGADPIKLTDAGQLALDGPDPAETRECV